MFANLVESNPHKGDYARKGSFFLGTLAIYGVIFLALGVGGIYAYNNQIENRDLELISMLNLAESPEEQQQPVRKPAANKPSGGNSNPRTIVVKTQPVMITTDPTRTPDRTYVSSPVPELPVGTIHKIGVPGAGDNIFGTGDRPGDGSGRNGTGSGSKEVDEFVKDAPPPEMKVEADKKPQSTRVKSMGVINGMAKQLPRPVYSPIAKAARAQGTVQVQVLIDEQGKVISANALSGHQLLLRESVQAALQARFTPTYLSNQPVKVSGIITYNFVLQ